jgi:small conductance mechanosensitive channel
VESKTYIDRIVDFTWTFGPKVLTALLLLFGGLWLIRRLIGGMRLLLESRRVDPSVQPFFLTLTDVGLKAILLLVVASTIGLQTTSFIAVFSAIAFSIGLALQGSLGNFASGVLILLFRPFRVGDLITAAGQTGRVREIQIFNTILLSAQGKKIIVPNGKLTDGPIVNVAEKAEVLAEVQLSIDPGTSLALLRSVAERVAAVCPWALTDRPVKVEVSGVWREHMKATVGCWVPGERYEDSLPFFYEALKHGFDEAGIRFAPARWREDDKTDA